MPKARNSTNWEKIELLRKTNGSKKGGRKNQSEEISAEKLFASHTQRTKTGREREGEIFKRSKKKKKMRKK